METGSATYQRLLEFDQVIPAAVLQTQIEHLAIQLRTALANAQPDWLGHLKILLEAAQEVAYVSITGADQAPTWRGTLTEPLIAVRITVYAVIWAMPDTAVAAIINATVQKHPLLQASLHE
jgi:hypothetical protein